MARFLVVLDVDSTLIENEAIELLAEEAGSLERVAAITREAMAGEREFSDSLAERVATLRGLPLAVLKQVRSRIELTRGARELVHAVHAADGVACVVSGGFHELLDPIAADLRLDAYRANRLETDGAVLTGRTTGTVIDAEAKTAALREWADRFGVPLSRTVAVGDGANDMGMMAIAGLSVAFDARAVVRRAADVSLPTRDLSSVRALLGI